MIRPIFRFDSREAWFPVGVEESLRATEAYIHGMPHPNEPPAARGHSLKSGNRRLDFPDDMKQPDLPPVVYCRTVKGGPRMPDWLQFWLWYNYNPGPPAPAGLKLGLGNHEGDWELVQYAYVGDPDAPLLVTASQHRTAGKREAWSCQRRDGRPVLYVARGSHAMFFTPGRYETVDVCDAAGRTLEDYEVRPFGKWATWPGRWGNSQGEGKSPESPGCQGIRWKAPRLFHSQARQA